MVKIYESDKSLLVDVPKTDRALMLYDLVVSRCWIYY